MCVMSRNLNVDLCNMKSIMEFNTKISICGIGIY